MRLLFTICLFFTMACGPTKSEGPATESNTNPMAEAVEDPAIQTNAANTDEGNGIFNNFLDQSAIIRSGVVCELENGVVGQPLDTEAIIRVSDSNGSQLGENHSHDGTCSLQLQPGSYSVTLTLPKYNIVYNFPVVQVCEKSFTPIQLVLDPDRAKAGVDIADFEVPCEGF